MSVPYGWGIQGILPHDFTKDQVIGNIRVLLRLGFCSRIVEVVNGKVLEFTFYNNEVQIDEINGAEGERILALWDDGYAGSMSHDDWMDLSPDSASVFLPSEKSFFEQLENIEGRPVYIESINDVLDRIRELQKELSEEIHPETPEYLEDYKLFFERALENDFIISISA